MTNYYCNNCRQDFLKQYDISKYSLFETDYQLDKIYKHTIAEPSFGITSSFCDKSHENYKYLTELAIASGSLEVNEEGNRVKYNIVYGTNEHVGTKFFNGSAVLKEDAIKVVLPTVHGRTHSFTTGSTGLKKAKCSKCGKTIG